MLCLSDTISFERMVENLSDTVLKNRDLDLLGDLMDDIEEQQEIANETISQVFP